MSTAKSNSMVDETASASSPQGFHELNGVADSDPVLANPTSLPKTPAATAPEASQETAAERSPKRSREVDKDEEDTLPVPKRLATEVETKTEVTRHIPPTESSPVKESLAFGSNDNVNGIVEQEQPKKQSKISSKKVVAKLNRGRACAECKKRKVKCKHITSGEATGDEVNTPESLSLPEPTDKRAKGSKPMEAEDHVEPDTSQAPIPLHTVAEEGYGGTPAEAETPKKTNPKKTVVSKKARAPPERTSTRNRKAPERFEDLDKQPFPKLLPTKGAPSKVFDPVYITTNSTSRLGKADLYHMLTNDDTAWTSLSSEQQITLVSMLPDTTETQRLLAKIRAGETEDTRPRYLKASDVFRTEVAKFQADLTNGHLAKTWQVAAGQAVAERAAGEYDAWKAEEAESWWGQKSK